MDGPSASLHRVADSIVDHFTTANAFTASFLGRVPQQIGNAGAATASNTTARARDWVATLDAIDPADLAHGDELLRRRALYEAKGQELAQAQHRLTFFCAPYQMGIVALIGGQLLRRLTLRTREERERYLALLESYATYFDDVRDALREQQRRFVRYPAAALPGSIATVEGAIAGLAALRPAGETSGDAERLIETRIRPAAHAVLDELRGPCTRGASGLVGLHQYDDGGELYEALARHHTTLPLTPEQLHREGLELVAELEARMAEIRAATGFDGDQAAFHAALASDPRVHASNADEVGALYRRHLARVELQFPRWFGARRVPPYEVRRLPPEAEAGMTFGFYQPPSSDGREAGRYNYNGSDLANRSTIGAASLVLHEIVPGHHLHLATDQLDTSKPPLRRLATVTAYNEGWAEYAADLGWEMGIYDTPLDQYGRLSMKLFRAARLVVDTGLNSLGWPLEKARAYMRAHSMMSEVEIASETLRYATDLPGQALAYASGCSRMWMLRHDVERALGDRFDLVGFHDAVLEGSSLPLDDLRWHVLQRLVSNDAAHRAEA